MRAFSYMRKIRNILILPRAVSRPADEHQHSTQAKPSCFRTQTECSSTPTVCLRLFSASFFARTAVDPGKKRRKWSHAPHLAQKSIYGSACHIHVFCCSSDLARQPPLVLRGSVSPTTDAGEFPNGTFHSAVFIIKKKKEGAPLARGALLHVRLWMYFDEEASNELNIAWNGHFSVLSHSSWSSWKQPKRADAPNRSISSYLWWYGGCVRVGRWAVDKTDHKRWSVTFRCNRWIYF